MKYSNIKCAIICISIISALSLLQVFASDKKSTVKQKRPVIITGDRARIRLTGVFKGIKRYITEITGNPRIISGKIKLRTNKIIVHGSNGEVAECVGRVVLIDRGNNSIIRSNRAVFYKKDNRVELKGNPRIITRRDDDNSIVNLKANRIVYRIDDETAHASGAVYVKNRDVRISSGRAIYLKSKSRIEFSKNPVIRKNRDIFKADLITYHIDKRIVLLERNVHITTFSEEKDSKSGGIKWVKAVTRGDRVIHDEGDKRTVIEGNAVVERDDSTFLGKRIEIWGKNSEFMIGTDVHIIYRDENIEALGKHFKYYKDKKYAVLCGAPYIIVKGKQEGKERARIYGDYMEFYQDIDELFVSGNVVIYHDSETIRGEMARYLRKENNMYITGSPVVERDGSSLTADLILFNTESYSAKLIGNIRGLNIR